VIRCPRCPTDCETVGQLAAHLVEDHLVSSSVALKEAREAAQAAQAATNAPLPAPHPPLASTTGAGEPSAAKETPMAKDYECPKCEFRSQRIQGISRHLSETHGIQNKAERAALLNGEPVPSAKTPTGGGQAPCQVEARRGEPRCA
jgi:hypothetical protein